MGVKGVMHDDGPLVRVFVMNKKNYELPSLLVRVLWSQKSSFMRLFMAFFYHDMVVETTLPKIRLLKNCHKTAHLSYSNLIIRVVMCVSMS